MADLRRAVNLLMGLRLMDMSLYWLSEIDRVILDLRGNGLPEDDPLRFGEDGRKLSERELSERLQVLIDSWSVERIKRGRKKNTKSRRKATR